MASTEFTIHHFKQTLRLIASCPEVERVNIIAHSRGTAVATDGIRELHLEIRGTADTRATLKLGTLVLAASDIDLDVMIARNATERIGRAVERTVLYISKEDKALSLSNWLFGGASRVGNLDAVLFDRQEIEVLRHSHHLQLIDAQVEVKDALGHSYFYANPAVSSDIILLIRFGLLPGRAHGRPLGVSEMGIWALDDAYPGADWTPPAAHERIDKTN